MGEWAYRPTFSLSWHWLEVSGQLHTLATLPPGREPPSTNWIGNWVGPGSSLDNMERGKYLILLELGLQPLGHPAHILKLPMWYL
jgi:hypothetical protein